MLAQYLYLSAMYAMAQGVAPPRIRATAAAILILVVNLIGYGFGPPAIGWLSDFLASQALAEVGLTLQQCKAALPDQAAVCAAGSAAGLQGAMQLGCIVFLWAGFHFYMAWRSLARDWHAEA